MLRKKMFDISEFQRMRWENFSTLVSMCTNNFILVEPWQRLSSLFSQFLSVFSFTKIHFPLLPACCFVFQRVYIHFTLCLLDSCCSKLDLSHSFYPAKNGNKEQIEMTKREHKSFLSTWEKEKRTSETGQESMRFELNEDVHSALIVSQFQHRRLKIINGSSDWFWFIYLVGIFCLHDRFKLILKGGRRRWVKGNFIYLRFSNLFCTIILRKEENEEINIISPSFFAVFYTKVKENIIHKQNFGKSRHHT